MAHWQMLPLQNDVKKVVLLHLVVVIQEITMVICEKQRSLVCGILRGLALGNCRTAELMVDDLRCILKKRLQKSSHRINDKTSVEPEAAIEAKGLVCETAPAGNHCHNPAEPAIQTFKSCFISILGGIDEDHPKGAWDWCLIPQTDMTLNPLHKCTIDAVHSTCSCVCGPCDFDAHPLAPLDVRQSHISKQQAKGGKR